MSENLRTSSPEGYRSRLEGAALFIASIGVIPFALEQGPNAPNKSPESASNLGNPETFEPDITFF